MYFLIPCKSIKCINWAVTFYNTSCYHGKALTTNTAAVCRFHFFLQQCEKGKPVLPLILSEPLFSLQHGFPVNVKAGWDWKERFWQINLRCNNPLLVWVQHKARGGCILSNFILWGDTPPYGTVILHLKSILVGSITCGCVSWLLKVGICCFTKNSSCSLNRVDYTGNWKSKSMAIKKDQA